MNGEGKDEVSLQIDLRWLITNASSKVMLLLHCYVIAITCWEFVGIRPR